MSPRAARARAAALKQIDEVLISARGRSHGLVAAYIMSMFDPEGSRFFHIEDFPLDKISVDELFWPVVADWWPMCEYIPYKFSKLMRRLKPCWSPDCMSKEDRPLYDALPDRLTIYRGQCRGERPKSSWTLDLERAKWFGQRNSLFRGGRARRLHGDAVATPPPVVLTATTAKANVALHLASRNESEVVLFRCPRITSILAPEPHQAASTRAAARSTI